MDKASEGCNEGCNESCNEGCNSGHANVRVEGWRYCDDFEDVILIALKTQLQR